jgi:glutamine synthetase
MSARLQQWVAGQLACGRDFSVFYAPYVNSYRRYMAGTFAPTRLAAGIHGITHGLKFDGLYTGDAYKDPNVREVPKSLYEASSLLEQSKIAREAFGDVVVDHYVNTARQEQAVYDRRVTDLDLLRNFERA